MGLNLLTSLIYGEFRGIGWTPIPVKFTLDILGNLTGMDLCSHHADIVVIVVGISDNVKDTCLVRLYGWGKVYLHGAACRWKQRTH